MRTTLYRVMLLATFVIGGVASPTYAHLDPELAGYVQVDGGKIWYRLNGLEHKNSDKAAIVYLHGGPGGGHRSAMPIVSLSDERTVILYDQLDSGNSERVGDPANWKLPRFVTALKQVVKALDLKKVVVIGASWGTAVATAYAAENPTGLEGVILVGPYLNTERWIADANRYISELPVDVRDTLLAHQAAGTTESDEYRAAEKVYLSRHMCRVTPCPGAEYLEGGPKFNYELYKHMWGPTEFHATGTLKNMDLTSLLGDLEMPTLFVCGEYDEASPESCRYFSGMVEDSSVAIIPDAGHALIREKEEVFILTVREYLKAKNL